MKYEDFTRNMEGASVFTVGFHNINSRKTDYECQLEICTGNRFFSL